ncbi:hypothetical protein RHMOL_Rhmol05G0213900 [Rhododendron molle]|uniref:Uncharacterized protein n=1 Tax=Rhododendron molle TaxID=49168 RepID=A0ACC0NRN7_RHOML|nr:hypothetical protein RHMOL_Rhmol05G0213900 [Rhododendron molle]
MDNAGGKVCDLTLQAEHNVGAIDVETWFGPTDGGTGFGPTDGGAWFDVETYLGFQDMLLMDPSVGFDIDFRIGSDYVNLNEDIGNGHLGGGADVQDIPVRGKGRAVRSRGSVVQVRGRGGVVQAKGRGHVVQARERGHAVQARGRGNVV